MGNFTSFFREFCKNLLIDLLGIILERIHHKPRSQIFFELFERLHMNTSFLPSYPISFQDLRKTTPLLFQGYVESLSGDLLPNETIIDPSKSTSGGMISTAQDIQKWTRAFFNGDVVHSIETMLMPSARRTHRYANALGYGYGIQISKEENVFETSHSGYVPGFISTLLYYPDYKFYSENGW